MEATIKSIRETTEGVHLQVSFGEETALIYLWQMVPSDASKARLALKYKSPPRKLSPGALCSSRGCASGCPVSYEYLQKNTLHG